MATRTPDLARKRRHTKACGRCRKRKIRCDFQYPTCGACSAAGATCLGFDSVDGSDKPRSTVRHLEEQVARLEINLAGLKSQSSNIADDVATAAHELATDLAKAIVEPTRHAHKQENLLPLTSRYFLSDSPLPQLNRGSWDDHKSAETQRQSSPAVAISSIPRHIVDAMLKHYCETYRPQYPSIGEADLYDARDRVCENPQLGGFDAFVIAITLAISSNTLMHIDGKRAATTTSGLWATAVAHLNEVGLTNSWERLQALQLLTHYGFLNPQDVNVSHCAAAASRLAFHCGLHRELPPSTQMKLDPTILNTRRRMFWNAYAIDAAAHNVRCQPFRWSRPEITAKFPESEPQATQTHSAHVWSLREIECDVTIGLEYPILALEFPDLDTSFEDWCSRTQNRLDLWYQSIRQSVTLTDKIEFHELLFQVQVLRLNRPSPRCPTPSPEMQKKAIKASIALIKEYSVFDRLGKMFMIWHAAHCVIEAGVYLLSSVLAGIEFQSEDRLCIDGEDVTVLIRYIKTFPNLVWKISRRWPSIMQHASTIEAISVSALEILQQWSDGQESWQAELSTLKLKLAQLKRLSSTSFQEQAPNPVLTQVTPSGLIPTTSTTHLAAHPGFTFEYPDYRMSTAEQMTSLDSEWLGSQGNLDRSLPVFQESYGVDYGDPMMWNFDGLDSEEIFAALLDGGGSETLMLGEQG